MKRLIIAIFIMIMAISCGDSKPSAESTSDASAQLETVSAGFIEKLKEEYKGKTLIVNFFASWCPPCRGGETPDFVAAYEKHKDNGFVIVGLSVDKKSKRCS